MKMEVNGVPVVEASNMDNCYALKHKDGHIWKPNKQGKYEVKVKVEKGKEDMNYIKFSSFILV